MKASVLAGAILLAAQPAFAGDWIDYDDAYDVYQGCCADTYVYYGGSVYAPREYAPRVIVPYGYVYSAEPEIYGTECTITRKYRRGYVRERIECDDD